MTSKRHRNSGDQRGAHGWRGLAFGASLAALAAMPALADPGILLADGRAADSARLATGEQLLLSGRDGALAFAGKQVELSGFTGIVGYANDLAYVAVIEGSAKIGEVKAEPGWLLILKPYGAPTTAEQFDAIRLSRKWSDASKAASPAAFASLERIRSGQEVGVWLGRLGQTNFNVAASGSAEQEKKTRALLGDTTVRDIRFSGDGSPAAIEQQVADRFLAALAARDVETVAALLDPVPFGNTDLRNGASDARQAMALALVAGRDWPALLDQARAQRAAPAGNEWTIAGPAANGVLKLRPMGDFVFVQTISVGKTS